MATRHSDDTHLVLFEIPQIPRRGSADDSNNNAVGGFSPSSPNRSVRSETYAEINYPPLIDTRRSVSEENRPQPTQPLSSLTNWIIDWLWRKAFALILPALPGMRGSNGTSNEVEHSQEHDIQNGSFRPRSQSIMAQQMGRELRGLADSFKAVNGANRRRSQSLVGNHL